MEKFKLKPLPKGLNVDSIGIYKALADANRSLAELKGEVKKIPNSQILIETISLQEAKDSNEIENIVTTDDEIYQVKLESIPTSLEAKEAENYANAMRIGFELIQNRGIITISDICKIQALISPNHPLRKIPGTVLKNPSSGEIVYTPPQNYNEIQQLLDNLEEYINNADLHPIDSLIKMPIIHFQFESIHPFFDGNGRTGRILNILYLVQQNLLDIPVLYLSKYIIKNKKDYYRLLQEVRTDDKWEEWIIWMLKGVELTAKDTLVVVNKIKDLMDEYKIIMRENFKFYSHDILNLIFKHPYTKIEFLERELHIHRHTARTYLEALYSNQLLDKMTVGRTSYYINVRLLQVLKNR